MYTKSKELELPILYSFEAFITIISLPENCVLIPQSEDSGTATGQRYTYRLGQDCDPTQIFAPLTSRHNRYSVVVLQLLLSGIFSMLSKDRDLTKLFSILCFEGRSQVDKAKKIFFDYLATKLNESNISQLISACRTELETLSLANAPSILANHANIDKRLSPNLINLYQELGCKMDSYSTDLTHILSIHRVAASSEQSTNTIRHILVVMFFTLPSLLTAIARKDEKKQFSILPSDASSVASHANSYANMASIPSKGAPSSHIGSIYSRASTQPGASRTPVARGGAWTSHVSTTSRRSDLRFS